MTDLGLVLNIVKLKSKAGDIRETRHVLSLEGEGG